MEMMNPLPNINGSSRESLVAARRKAMDAVNTAIAALREVRPHGRDYQTAPDPAEALRTDQKRHNEREGALIEIYLLLQDEALAIQNGTGA